MNDEFNNVLKYENTTAILAFSNHEQVKSYKRTAYNLLDMLGDIGGLYDGLKLLFSAILTVISGTDYMSLLISKLFFVGKSMSNQ